MLDALWIDPLVVKLRTEVPVLPGLDGSSCRRSPVDVEVETVGSRFSCLDPTCSLTGLVLVVVVDVGIDTSHPTVDRQSKVLDLLSCKVERAVLRVLILPNGQSVDPGIATRVEELLALQVDPVTVFHLPLPPFLAKVPPGCFFVPFLAT